MSKNKPLGILTRITFQNLSESLEKESKFQIKVSDQQELWSIRIMGIEIRTKSPNLGKCFSFKGIRVLSYNSYNMISGWYDFSSKDNDARGIIREI